MSKRMKRMALVLVLFVCSLIFSGAYQDLAFADISFGGGGWSTGDGEPGPTPGGGMSDCKNEAGAKNYRIDCTGASWIYYSLESGGGSWGDSPVQFAAPFTTYAHNRDLEVETIPESCASYGGFWHYGVNGLGIHKSAYSGSSYGWANYGYIMGSNYLIGVGNNEIKPGLEAENYYSIPDGVWGHWSSLGYAAWNWVSDEQREFGDDAQKITSAQGDTIFKASKVVPSPDGGTVTIPGAIQTNYTYSGDKKLILESYRRMCYTATGASECWSKELPKGLSIFCWGHNLEARQTKTRVDVVDPVASAETGWNTFLHLKETVPDVIEVSAGTEMTVKFTHHIKSSKQYDSVSWTIAMSDNTTSGNIIVTAPSSTEYNGSAVMAVGLGDNYYSAVRGTTIIKEHTYTIKVNSSSDDRLCERIYINDKPSNYTEACVTFRAKAAATYEAQSMVSVDSNVADTGQVGTYTEKSTDTIKSYDIGETATINFVHRGFASESKKKVPYKVTDTPTTSSSYEITRADGRAVGADISAKANLTTRTSGAWYSTSGATVGDIFTVTFNAAGDYNFCETFYVDGIKYTKVCAKFKVANPASGKVVGVSQVAGNGNIKNTGVVTSDMSAVSKTLDLGEYKPGDTVSFSFQHWGGINPKGKGSWSVHAEMMTSPGGFTGGSWVGDDAHRNVSMKVLYLNYGGTKYYSSSSGGGLVGSNSNTYNYRVYNRGSYRFCQKLTVNGAQLTEVCAEWIVPDTDSCADAAEDETKVSSYVKNDSTGAQGSVVYAKPNDTVTWHECYYAGVQKYANQYVTVTHAEPDHPEWPASDPSANTNVLFKNAITWGNFYVVSYPDGASGGNTYSAGSIINNSSISHSMKIKPGHVGYTESSLKDYIESSTPVRASYHNEGIHYWECRPSSTNTGGTVAKEDWVSYNPKQYHDECDGTEKYVCEGEWSGPDSDNNCSKTVSSTENVDANASVGLSCPSSDWSGPDSDGNCSKTENTVYAASEVTEYSCSKYKKAIYLSGSSCYKKSDFSGTAYDAEAVGSHYECSDEHDNMFAMPYVISYNPLTLGTAYACQHTSNTITTASTTTSYSCDSGDSGPYVSGTWHYCKHPTQSVKTTPATTKKCYNTAGTTEIGYTQVEDLHLAPVEWYQNPMCRHSNDRITYSYVTGPSTATSGVRVPYNYKLTASIDVGTGVVYSGETMSLNKGVVNVETKYNSVTSGNYATIAKDVKTKLIAFVSSTNITGGAGTVSSNDLCGMVSNKQCAVLAENSGQTFNSAGTVNGSKDNTVYSGSWNAFDAKAGDYVCFMMAVYPATSGSDTNMGDFDGDGMWYRSNAACKIIAKKPTFQVWGGGLFSGGNVTSSVSEKRNLYPLYPDYFPAYQKSGSTNSKLFGSWVEQNLTLVGTTGTVASGSALAGGSTHVGATDFCRYRVPLSFANYSSVGCPSVQKAGAMGLSTTSFGSTSNRNNYMDYWLGTTPAANVAGGSTIDLTSSSSYGMLQSDSGVSIRYSVASGDVRLSATTIDKSVTHFVKASAGNVYIDGNIYYNANGLTNINQVPKLVIYGRNIYINCGVTEIDAVLISEGTIDTCKDGGGDSASTRSNQLYIRGMTISNTLTLGRTYGAATGVYSDVPAEIINYDSSAILWGKHMAGVGESNRMTMTYTRELAPRY